MAAEPRGEAGELVAARVIAARPTTEARPARDGPPPARRTRGHRRGDRRGRDRQELRHGRRSRRLGAGRASSCESSAPTWRAANVLSAEGLEAMTVAGLLRDLDRGELGLSPRSVLLVDEAGMVGSEHLARVIAHADEAGAKLVLVGDPEQLGPIEAGGLFSAIAERTEPVHLHEVIRHNHELDRDAAKLIREGAGREALASTDPRSGSRSPEPPRSAAWRWSRTGGAPTPRARTR